MEDFEKFVKDFYKEEEKFHQKILGANYRKTKIKTKEYSMLEMRKTAFGVFHRLVGKTNFVKEANNFLDKENRKVEYNGKTVGYNWKNKKVLIKLKKSGEPAKVWFRV